MKLSVTIAPLSEEDGGGYIGTVPDLPGCMGDGETPEAALADTLSAINGWLETDRLRQMGDDLSALKQRFSKLEKRVEEMDHRLTPTPLFGDHGVLAMMSRVDTQPNRRHDESDHQDGEQAPT